MRAEREKDSSTRRSTRARAAATSSTARWRSSIRPWSETANSTTSCFASPPSSTSCARRIAESLENASQATTSATAATATATIAITVAASISLAQREDDRVLGRVVGGVLLLRHRRHVDFDRRPSRELHLAEVVEGDGLLLA